MRNIISEFYAYQALVKVPITPTDHAEAAFLLISLRLFPKTTGQVIRVDASLLDGFLC